MAKPNVETLGYYHTSLRDGWAGGKRGYSAFYSRQILLVAIAALLLLAAGALASPSQQPSLEDLTNAFKIHLWNYGLDVRNALGYKDNVLLSHTNRQGSAFWDGGGDVLVFRLPSGNWLFNGMVAGDYIHYFGGSIASDEQTVFGVAQLSRTFGQHWTAALGANYAYQDQVMDLSAIEPEQPGAGRVLGHTFTGRSSVRGQYGPGWAEAEMTGTRQLLQSPLDSYWQFGPKLTLGRHLGKQDDLTLSCQWTRFYYDHRMDFDRQGNALTNSSLAMMSQAVQLAWRHGWDQSGRWHTTLTAGFASDQDNSSGYFDADCYSLSPKVEYRAGRWMFSASVGGAAYDFPVQTVAIAGGPHRTKTWLGANARAEWKATKVLKLQANYNFDRSYSNLDIDDYSAHTFSVGVELQF